jgi:hypothetical protein
MRLVGEAIVERDRALAQAVVVHQALSVPCRKAGLGPLA